MCRFSIVQYAGDKRDRTPSSYRSLALDFAAPPEIFSAAVELYFAGATV
jgi:hypothetical protein